jgi:hypothetical protein
MGETPAPRALPRGRPRQLDLHPAAYTASETTVLLVAGVTVVGGLISVAAAVEQAARFPAYARVYWVLAGIEIAWAALVVWRSSNELLLFGLAFTILELAVWGYVQAAALSRGVGTGGGIHAIFWCTATLGGASSGWHAIGATIVQPLSEAVAALGLSSVLLAQRAALARRITERSAPLLLSVLLLSVLYGVGAHGG